MVVISSINTFKAFPEEQYGYNQKKREKTRRYNIKKCFFSFYVNSALCFSTSSLWLRLPLMSNRNTTTGALRICHPKYAVASLSMNFLLTAIWELKFRLKLLYCLELRARMCACVPLCTLCGQLFAFMAFNSGARVKKYKINKKI